MDILLNKESFIISQDKPTNGTSSRGGFRGGPRKRGGGRGSRGGRGSGIGRGRGSTANVRLVAPPIEIPTVPKDPTIEDHSDKQWTEVMMGNLMQCNQIVGEKLGISGEKGDFASLLHEEWMKIYPHSTLNARNIKSRLTVYLKTMGESAQQPPIKKRKIENSVTPTKVSP